MAKSWPEDEDTGEGFPGDAGEEPTQATNSAGGSSGKARPVHEERIGRVKAVVWANQTANGIRHNVLFRRVFKREGSGNWEQTDSFGREELPLVMEVARRAWLWVYGQGQG